MTERYMIVRFFLRGSRKPIIARGLTREEAEAHCNDPETSWKTAKGKSARALTRKRGPWFDGMTTDRDHY